MLVVSRLAINNVYYLIDSTFPEGATIVLLNWYKNLVGSILTRLLSF